MSFDAGAVTGSLTLDVAHFVTSLGTAENSAGQLGGAIQQSLVSPTEQAAAAIGEAAQSADASFAGIAEAVESTAGSIDQATQASSNLGNALSSLKGPADGAKESTDHVGSSLQSLTSSQEGASSSAQGLSGSMGEGAAAGGPYAAAVLAIVEAAKAAISVLKEFASVVKDMTVDVGNSEAELSLAAEKAGVPIAKFSELASVAKVVGVNSEELGSAFKFLQKNAVDAVEGDDKLTQSFKDLGITTEFLKENINDSAAIFGAVQTGMSQLGSNAERAKEAMQLLGREGSDLVPLFDMSSESIKRLGDDMKELGAVDDESTGRSARTWKLLSTYIDAAWEGIKKAVAEPILNYLADHIDEIIPKIIQFSGYIREGIAEAFKIAKPIVEGFWHILEALGGAVEKGLIPGFNTLIPTLETIAKLIGSLENDIASFITGVTNAIAAVKQLSKIVDTVTVLGGVKAIVNAIGSQIPNGNSPFTPITDPGMKAPPSGGYSGLVNAPINVNVNTTLASEKKEHAHKTSKEIGDKVQKAVHQALTARNVAAGMGGRHSR